jgi:hypothetical protein
MTIALVLRVAPEALAAGRLAGEAELVGTGARVVVRDAAELVAFARGDAREPTEVGKTD